MRWLRTPAIHFVLIGAALFAMRRAVDAPPAHVAPAAPAAPLLTRTQLEQIRADFTRQTGTTPTPDDEHALVQRSIDEEVLYREALARGLDQDDESVRGRLVDKMRFLTDAEESEEHADVLYREALGLRLDKDDVIVRRILVQKMRLLTEREEDAGPAPSDAELQAYLDEHAERYREPRRVTLSHVFVSAALHGAAIDRDARALLARLRADGAADVWARLGDPFPAGQLIRAQSERDLAKVFGEAFATTVLALPPGRWSGPLQSVHGLHLVRVEARDPQRVSPLAAVRPRVQAALLEDRRRERLAAALARLRAKYGAPSAGEPAGTVSSSG